MKTLAVGILAFSVLPVLAEERGALAPREVPGAALQLRGFDPLTRTMVLVGESGREQVFRVDEPTLAAVSTLSPGESLLVSYRYNRDAQVEVILRGLPAGRTLGTARSR